MLAAFCLFAHRHSQPAESVFAGGGAREHNGTKKKHLKTLQIAMRSNDEHRWVKQHADL